MKNATVTCCHEGREGDCEKLEGASEEREDEEFRLKGAVCIR